MTHAELRRSVAKVIAPDDFDALLAVAKEPYRTMILMQRAVGMRPGEVCRMRTKQMHADIGEFVVPRDGKTGERPMCFDPAGRFAVALAAWMQSRPDGPYLFGGEHMVRVDTYWRTIERYCDRAHIARVKPYVFRHTWANDMLRRVDTSDGIERRITIADVAEMMGNKPQTVATYYVHADPDVMRRAVAGL